MIRHALTNAPINPADTADGYSKNKLRFDVFDVLKLIVLTLSKYSK